MKLSPELPPTAEEWGQFLAKVSSTYSDFDKDRELVERSFEVSSKELQDQRAQIVMSSKMSALGEMAGGIAHEINTPLNIFTMYAEMLLEMTGRNIMDFELVRDAAITINETAIRISKIVLGLRNFSRGSYSEPMRKVKISTVINDTLVLCKHNFDIEGIKLIVDEIPDSLSLECREIAISQVLINLLNNAKDAVANQEDKWVRIECKQVNDFICCSVTDSGPGISKPNRDKLMEPFFTTKGIGKGTGLGLSISKGIIEGHDGSLQYDDNSPNTRFTISLPIHQSTNALAAA